MFVEGEEGQAEALMDFLDAALYDAATRLVKDGFTVSPDQSGALYESSATDVRELRGPNAAKLATALTDR